MTLNYASRHEIIAGQISSFEKPTEVETVTYGTLNDADACEGYADWLKAYVTYRSDITPNEKRLYLKLKEQLDATALLCREIQPIYGQLTNNGWFKHYPLPAHLPVQKSLEKLADIIAKELSKSHEVLFPGGYGSAFFEGKKTNGHFFLQRIHKNAQGYWLDRFNAGAGCPVLDEENAIIATATSNLIRAKDDASLKDFIVQNLSQYIYPKNREDIPENPGKRISETIDAALDPEKHVLKTGYRQGKPNCLTRSIREFIHYQLSPEQAEQFYQFVVKPTATEQTFLKQYFALNEKVDFLNPAAVVTAQRVKPIPSQGK